MLTHHIKVSIKGKKPIYLENPKYAGQPKGYQTGAARFISGHEVDRFAEPVLGNKGQSDILHLIELGPGVTITNMVCCPMYGMLEKADPATGRHVHCHLARR